MKNYFAAIVILVLIGIFSGGCVVTKIHTMPVKEYSASYNDVWDSAILYLDRQDEPIVMADKEKGMIYTDWVNEQKVFVTKRYRYNIEIAKIDENQTEVAIESPQEAYSMGDWEEILPQERKAKRMFSAIKSNLKKIQRNKIAENHSGISNIISEKPFNKYTRGISRQE